MRRRTKRGPNNSESTGRIGQEIPVNQPAPLQPSYGTDVPRASEVRGNDETRRETKPLAPVPSAANAASPAQSAGGEKREPRQGRPNRRKRGGRGVPRPQGLVAVQGVVQNAGVFAEPIGRFAEPAEEEPSEYDPFVGEDTDDDFGDDDGPSSLEAPSDEPAGVVGKLVMETQPESPSVAPPEAQAVKAARGFVVLAIGLPGSGKTTWFKRRGVTPLSSDMLRSILFDDITEQRYQGLVFSTLRSLLRARLIAKMPWNYVDATNLSPHERRQWIKMAKSFGYEVQAVFFDVPFEVCMERNHRRERTVSDETMQKMAERLRPPNFKEGFSKITVVRVKGSAGSGDISAAAAAPDDAVLPETPVIVPETQD